MQIESSQHSFTVTGDRAAKKPGAQLYVLQVYAQLTRPLGVLTHWWAHCGAEGLEQLLRAHPAPSSDLSAQLVKPLHTRRGSTHSPLPH